MFYQTKIDDVLFKMANKIMPLEATKSENAADPKKQRNTFVLRSVESFFSLFYMNGMPLYNGFKFLWHS
jgi:hypothetical protein